MAAVDEAHVTAEARLARRILEELIFERVRVAVNLADLTRFELDLGVSIARALADVEPTDPQKRRELAFDYLQRAWERVSDDVLGDLWSSG